MIGKYALVTGVLVGVLCSMQVAQAESLYREQSYRPLVSDYHARRIGDILTVLVFENSSATTSADTTTSSNTEIETGVSTKKIDKSFKLDLDSTNSGSGRIQRSGKLLAQISVTVQSVAANGDLLIQGEQLIEVNGEKQQITLEGRVRQQDIGENNTIASNRLADGKISYVGAGILGDQQSPNWFTRLFGFLFRPF